MNEAIENFFEKSIKSYEAIETLSHNGLFDEEEKTVHEHNLLFGIIDMMRSELFLK